MMLQTKQITSVYGSDVYGTFASNVSNITDTYAESLVEEIMEIYTSVKDLEDNDVLQGYSNHLEAILQRLDYLIALNINDTYVKKILCDFEFTSMFDSIARFRSLYTAKLEIEHAHSILKSRDPWEMLTNFSYLSNYIQLASTEYQGAGLKPGDTVVIIGSGPLPISLIILCHQYGVRGIGIEQEPERAELSRKVLEKLGFSDQIKIISGNHSTLPLKDTAGLIMVAAQAEPKQEIFDYLAKALPAGTKLSYRIYEKGLRRVLDTFSHYDLPESFEEYLRVRPEPPVNNTVVFVTKRD